MRTSAPSASTGPAPGPSPWSTARAGRTKPPPSSCSRPSSPATAARPRSRGTTTNPRAPSDGAPDAEKGAHDRSVLDLIDASTELLSPSTNAAEIAKFVHHQTADKFDVLRSDENEEGDHEVTAEEVDIAHQVLTRYYRLVVMDSGNTARAANWRRMIDHTNQLVVPVTAIEDRAEAARLTLQTLESRGGHDAELARNAVVIVSESTDAKRSMSGEALKRAKDEAQRIADGFAPFVRAVVRIPYDPALVNGPIRYEALQPATQRAWLAAAAAVAAGF